MAEGPIFGVIAAGRALQTDCVRVSETEFLFELPQASTINHIAVFLTGAIPLPAEIVYARWPQLDGGVGHGDWHFLGGLSANKPSAMFRFGQVNHQSAAAGHSMFAAGNATAGSVLLGIHVGPIAELEQKVAELDTAPKKESTMSQFTTKMLTNLVNHVQSYAVAMPNPQMPSQSVEVVPLRVVQDWFNRFQQRLRLNPDFWKYC
ncbi:hypothetical protein L596_004662 [Steinernema carpocapsae]|uniref:Uncharacterized protein n=1 Tax=Steinernema carpocapsae TaxID=34508 RepID=A0A4V6I8G1_STECR|nr:hypothetical protein L596_004662 [Steinernema carpocapsae]